MSSNTPLSRYAPPALLLAGIVGAAIFTASFPAVEGLGTKVRLPVFHGAMTWVNLAAFSVLALAALVHLIFKRDDLYPLLEGLRWIAVPMWVTGSVLGLLAALRTWDFTGSKASPLEVAAADPRLLAQFWILLAALGLIALGLVVDDRRLLAGADIAFVALMWAVILRAVLGPGRALHPDSPVMNSDEIAIKLLFLGIVASIGVASLAAAWMVARVRRPR
jgi:hypothetical protein